MRWPFSKAAQKEADSAMAGADRDAKQISGKKLDKAALKKIDDNVIFSELK